MIYAPVYWPLSTVRVTDGIFIRVNWAPFQFPITQSRPRGLCGSPWLLLIGMREKTGGRGVLGGRDRCVCGGEREGGEGEEGDVMLTLRVGLLLLPPPPSPHSPPTQVPLWSASSINFHFFPCGSDSYFHSYSYFPRIFRKLSRILVFPVFHVFFSYFSRIFVFLVFSYFYFFSRIFLILSRILAFPFFLVFFSRIFLVFSVLFPVFSYFHPFSYFPSFPCGSNSHMELNPFPHSPNYWSTRR